MILTLAAWPTWAIAILTLAFLVASALMVLAVLYQKPAGGGLAGAFGSNVTSGQTAFGAKTGDALTIFTISVFVIFLALAISLNFALRPTAAAKAPTPENPVQGTDDGKSAAPQEPNKEPAATPATIPPATTPTNPPATTPAGTPETAPANPPATNPPATNPPATNPAPSNPAPQNPATPK